MGPDTNSINTVQMKTFRDNITPFKVSLMVLVKEFCNVKNKMRESPSNDVDPIIHSNQQNRDFAITILKLIQGTDMELKELINVVKPVLHSRTYQLVIDRLQELRKQGVSGIMNYIQSLESLIVDPQQPVSVVHKSSVLGLFIRHMLLAFDKLSFNHVTKLYHKYCANFDIEFANNSENSSCENEVESIIGNALANVTFEENQLEETRVQASQKQAELFIAQQAALLQINEKEALTPLHLQQKIRELMKGNPELAEVHYLSFLNCLRVKEYCGAVHNLYHHFDRNTSISQDTKGGVIPEESTRSFRYAALNLAILHARFGHREEALASLNEAIMMAQEVNDNICLQHALSWLYQLTPENKENLIEHSIAKSAELSLWYLSSLGIQFLTQLKSLTSTEPAQVFELMMKSDILNCQHSMTELMGAAYAQRAALWTLYGNSSMSNLISQLLLHLNTSDPIRGGVYHLGEGICIALCNLAWVYAHQGQYNSANEILRCAIELFPPHSEHSHHWMLCEQSILFESYLYHGKWQDAEKAMTGIAVINKEESQYRKAQLLLNEGNTTESYELIKCLLNQCKHSQGPSPHFLVRVLLLETELLCQSSNYTMAIPALTKSISLCRSHHLMYLEALTMLHLAGVQLLMNIPSQALHHLDAVFITLLAHGSHYDKACAYLLYAKCTIAAVKQVTSDEVKKEAYLSAIPMITKAIEHFKAIEAHHRAKDAIYWKAHLYNKLGITSERNSCAREFRLLDQQYGSQIWHGTLIP